MMSEPIVAQWPRTPEAEGAYRRQCLAAIDAGLAESSYLLLLFPWDVENRTRRLAGDANAIRAWNHYCRTGDRTF